MFRVIVAVAFAAAASSAIADPYLFASPAAQARIGNESASAGEMGFGYGINQHLAGEISFFSVDRVVSNTDWGALTATAITSNASGVGVLAVGNFKVTESFFLIAKAGARRVRYTTRDEELDLVTAALTTNEITRSNWLPVVAVGAQYAVIDHTLALVFLLQQSDGSGEIPALRSISLGAALAW